MADGNFDSVSFDGSVGGFDVDAAVSTTNTHDGVDEHSYRRAKEAIAKQEKAFKSAKERLREVIERAWDGPQADTPQAAEVRAIAAPHVERLESGALRIDEAALHKHRKELLAFHAALRQDFERRIAIDEDDEDVMILAHWM